MYRYKIEELKKWKASKNRKPLIIRGARQVGKTWLAREFGQEAYEKVAYINFDRNPRMTTLFSQDFDTERILRGLQAESDTDIDPENTLIILDEIQEVPIAVPALKYFYENNPEYHIIVAGSLLGLAMRNGVSFPVGKVDFMDLGPLTFAEFLLALGQNRLVDLLNSGDWDLIRTFKDKFIDLLKTYYFIGGMPEVVKNYVEEKSWNTAREIQEKIILAYEQDFSKHASANIVPRIKQVWDNLPAQLAKDNKKFIYKLLGDGARAKEYEIALLWLEDAGLIRSVSRIETPKIPLKAYKSLKAFKIYLLDIGLLGAMVGLDAKVLLEKNDLFIEFKGSLTEQYVLQELESLVKTEICYWANDDGSKAEVDFIVQFDGEIVPIEVKAEENVRSQSLKSYRERYVPKTAVRVSMKDYRVDGGLTNLPLYAVRHLIELIKN